MTNKADGGLPLTLDHNGEIPVRIIEPAYNPKALPSLQVEINVSSLTSWRLLGAEKTKLTGRLGATVGGQPTSITAKNDAAKTIVLNITPNLAAAPNAPLTLTLDGEPIVTAIKSAGGIYHLDPARAHERLTVSELRTLSFSDNILKGSVPYPRDKLKGFDPKNHAPITDVHTHLTAQIKPINILKIAKEHGLSYPTELLELLGIDTKKKYNDKIKRDKSVEFKPLLNEGLECEKKDGTCDVIPLEYLDDEDLLTIANHMAVTQDNVLCLSQFENKMYRFCNPLAKNKAITKDMILKIAEEYASHNIKYVELSTGTVLDDTEFLENLLAAVPEAKEEYKVDIRFLVGVRRTKSTKPHEMLYDMEKVKFLAQHPYIVGMDFYGYELNKTSDFNWALEHMAQWASSWNDRNNPKHESGWNFRNNFLIRVHASETSKNHENLEQVLNIAKKYGICMRAAHAIRATESDALDQDININSPSSSEAGSKHPLFGLEFCPDSNLAYNHIRHVSQVPFDRWLNKAKAEHWFLATDGMGSMRTSPQQLALSALASGVTLEQLETLRTNEHTYIDRQQAFFKEKQGAFISRFAPAEHAGDINAANKAFVAGFTKHLAEIKKMSTLQNGEKILPLPQEFEGKTPILLIGASGSSWNRMDAGSQQKAKESIQKLVAELDPEKTYFVLGRRKDEGITAILEEALNDYHKAHPDKKFSVLGLNTANQSDIASCISWIMPQSGGHDKVAENIAYFMEHAPKAGMAIAVGGSSYTGDLIKLFDDATQHYLQEKAEQPDASKRKLRPIPVMMMESAEGASKEFTAYRDSSSFFKDNDTLLQGITHIIQSSFSCIFKDAILLAMPELPAIPTTKAASPVFMDSTMAITRPPVFSGAGK